VLKPGAAGGVGWQIRDCSLKATGDSSQALVSDQGGNFSSRPSFFETSSQSSTSSAVEAPSPHWEQDLHSGARGKKGLPLTQLLVGKTPLKTQRINQSEKDHGTKMF